MKQWEKVFNNNHSRLMRVHIGFVVFYIIAAIIYFYSAIGYGNTESSVLVIVVAFFTPFILLHGLLAVGAKKKIELSRKVSEIVFAIILLGFPIGTLLSMLYFLPKTTWKQPTK